MTDHLNMTEEEVDAEIEKMQQQLTLALQQIDENFASCNQNASKLLSEIDRYTEASQQMRNNSQKWLYFLQSMITERGSYISDEDTECSTNRPIIEDDTKDSFSYNHRGDITNGALTGSFGGRLRQSLRKTFTSPTDTTTSGQPIFTTRIKHSPSILSDTSSLSSRNKGPMLSPPRIIPMGLSSAQLQGTPIREQARILTENTLRSIGMRSSDSDSDGLPFVSSTPRSIYSQTSHKEIKDATQKTDNIKGWETSNMDTDDTESRTNFVKFLADRNKLQDLPDESVFKQPYLPEITSNKRFRPDDDNVSEPEASTPKRHEATPIRHEATPIRHEATPLIHEATPSRHESTPTRHEFTPNRFESPFNKFESPSNRFGSITSQSPIQPEDGAYEFSDGVQPNTILKRNYSGSYHSGSYHSGSYHSGSYHSGSITDKSSNTTGLVDEGQTTSSLIPAQFDLRFFPEQFRTPPGSIKLTKVYNEFQKRPGNLLTVKDIMDILNDSSYEEESIFIFIKLLTRKKFLKQVGDRNAWVIRT